MKEIMTLDDLAKIRTTINEDGKWLKSIVFAPHVNIDCIYTSDYTQGNFIFGIKFSVDFLPEGVDYIVTYEERKHGVL